VNPSRVRTQAEIEALLRSKGLEPTDKCTDTGRFWRHSMTMRHVQVPFAVDGMYPEFILKHLRGILEELGFGLLH
jgi:hypothetical protein